MHSTWDLADRAAAKVTPLPVTPAPLPAPDGVILQQGSSIKPQRIDWMWFEFIARGKLHVIGGMAGTGKTTAGLDLLAIKSRGGKWPDGTPCEAGRVAVWSGEDDAADTLLPRFLAAGGNPENLYFLRGTREGGETRPFDPSTDLTMLAESLEKVGGICLLLVDPIVSAVSGDSHKNGEVRRALQPLVDLAGRLDIAVLGITHFSKGTSGREPLERLTGSIAFGAIARVVFCVAKAKAEEGEEPKRLLVRAKSNIGPDGGGFEYGIDQVPVPGYPDIYASRVQWGEQLDGTAREVLAEAEASTQEERSDQETEGHAAEKFLRDMLDGGTTPTSTVKQEAIAAGLAWRTVQRAATNLQVTRKKAGMDGGWYWSLPKAPNNPEGATSGSPASSGAFLASSGDEEEF